MTRQELKYSRDEYIHLQEKFSLPHTPRVNLPHLTFSLQGRLQRGYSPAVQVTGFLWLDCHNDCD